MDTADYLIVGAIVTGFLTLSATVLMSYLIWNDTQYTLLFHQEIIQDIANKEIIKARLKVELLDLEKRHAKLDFRNSINNKI